MIITLDTFAGIGGFSLAAEIVNRRRGWRVFETVGFIENEKYCQGVLKSHWKDVPIHGDIRTATTRAFPGGVDLVTGGFPCTDLSRSGKKTGIRGSESGLFFEFLRLWDEFSDLQVRPPVILLENVANLLHGEGDNARIVFGELASRGLSIEWKVLSAESVGAPHLRERVFIIAFMEDPNSHIERLQGGAEDRIFGKSRKKFEEQPERLCERKEWGNWATQSELGPLVDGLPARLVAGQIWDHEPEGVPRVAHGVKGRVPALKAIGNAIVPEVATIPLMRVAEILGEI